MNHQPDQYSDSSPAHIAYAMMAISVVTAFPVFVAAILAWLNRNKTQDSMLVFHYDWILRTFWINFIVAIIGLVLTLVLVGYVILFLNQIWLIYRVARGWYRLTQNLPI